MQNLYLQNDYHFIKDANDPISLYVLHWFLFTSTLEYCLGEGDFSQEAGTVNSAETLVLKMQIYSNLIDVWGNNVSIKRILCLLMHDSTFEDH